MKFRVVRDNLIARHTQRGCWRVVLMRRLELCLLVIILRTRHGHTSDMCVLHAMMPSLQSGVCGRLLWSTSPVITSYSHDPPNKNCMHQLIQKKLLHYPLPRKSKKISLPSRAHGANHWLVRLRDPLPRKPKKLLHHLMESLLMSSNRMALEASNPFFFFLLASWWHWSKTADEQSNDVLTS